MAADNSEAELIALKDDEIDRLEGLVNVLTDRWIEAEKRFRETNTSFCELLAACRELIEDVRERHLDGVLRRHLIDKIDGLIHEQLGS